MNAAIRRRLAALLASGDCGLLVPVEPIAQPTLEAYRQAGAAVPARR